MSGIGPDPGPDVYLFHQGGRLRALSSSLRDATSRAAAGALRDALRLRAAVEERVCFPPLLAAGGSQAGEVVGASRKIRGELLDALEGPEGARDPAIPARVEAYASFEQERLLPLFAALPGVTLREMALEIQELVGRRGRARGA